MPKNVARSFGFHDELSIVSLVEPNPEHTVGLVATPQLTDPARTHKVTAAQVTAPPVVGEARYSLGDFTKRVIKAVQNTPLAPQEVPPLRLRADVEADGTTPTTTKPEPTPGTTVAR